jgi:siroheme synthase
VTAELIRHGLDPATPAATVADGGLPDQRVVRGTLGSIAATTGDAGIRPPAITVIGSVAGFDPNSAGI